MARPRTQPSSRRWYQRTNMPDCDRVKAMNTPSVYSGIRPLTLAWKTMSSAMAMPARAMMPVVKASRSPRKANWRGRKPSRARKDERRGKSAKLVLAASTRMRAVATWARIRIAAVTGDLADEQAEHRLLLARDRARCRSRWPGRRSPGTGSPKTTAAQVSVVRAFFHSGGLKAGHAIRDRLDAGQGHRALREGAEDEEKSQCLAAGLPISRSSSAGGVELAPACRSPPGPGPMPMTPSMTTMYR